MKNLWIVSALFLALVGVSYSAEVDEVQRAILEQGASWTARENRISSLPQEERQLRLGALPYTPTEEDLLNEGPLPEIVSTPTGMSWKNYGGNFVSSVKDQGYCGSCWAFSVTGALESQAMIQYGLSGANLNLSEQIVLSCSGAGNCSGGSPISASGFLYSQGTGSEGCFPYSSYYGSQASCSRACSNYENNVKRFVLNGYQSYYSPSVDTLKSLIATYGPVSACFGVYTDFYYYSGGIYRHTWGNFEGGHAIVVVGYNDNDSYFTVKNSWGPDWGESGFFRIAYSQVTGVVQFGSWGNNPTIAFNGVLPFKLNVTSPSKGALVTSGGTYSINWEVYPYSPGTFKLLYSLNGGTTWNLIADGVSGTSYTWTAPTVNRTKKSSMIKVVEFYNGKKVTSDTSATFTISPF
jgi:C1A family cysteine protease